MGRSCKTPPRPYLGSWEYSNLGTAVPGSVGFYTVVGLCGNHVDFYPTGKIYKFHNNLIISI
jgi:hypothetical protein